MVISGYFSGGLSVLLANTQEVDGLPGFSLRTAVAARAALDVMTGTLGSLAMARGAIGTGISRLGVSTSTNSVAVQNLIAARSRIADVDVADESARMVRTQILQQVGASVLAQANQLPTVAIQLLT